jgi:hypothetical protein
MIEPATAMMNPPGSPSPVPADQTAHESTDESAHDSQDSGEDKATRIAPRHEELGDDADDQTEHDPSDYVHDALLSRPLAALNALRSPWDRFPILTEPEVSEDD